MQKLLIVKSKVTEQIQENLSGLGYSIISVEPSLPSITSSITLNSPDIVIMEITESTTAIAMAIEESFNLPLLHVNGNLESDQILRLVQQILKFCLAIGIFSFS